MNGRLDLTLAPIDGRTRPTHVVAVPPLQCSRVRYDDPRCPDMAAFTLLHLGGVLQGDQLSIDITLKRGAASHISSAAATQVYRMPEQDAALTTSVTLHPCARLQYLPEPIILFAGARFTQTTRIVLHHGATLVWRELLAGGRLARNELHQYELYRASFEVCDSNGRCLVSERARLEPARVSPATLGIQSAYPVVGSLYLLALGTDLRAPLARIQQGLADQRDVLAEAGALPNECGLLVRVLGTTAQAVRAALEYAHSRANL